MLRAMSEPPISSLHDHRRLSNRAAARRAEKIRV
jgi:hypothetical protein